MQIGRQTRGRTRAWALGLALAGMWGWAVVVPVYGDVTGVVGLDVLAVPVACEQVPVGDATQTPYSALADQPCERTVSLFDIQSGLAVTLSTSGLLMTLHSHLGTTGLEDVILSLKTSLGVLDLATRSIFAAYDWNSVFQFYDRPRFVRHDVDLKLTVGGVDVRLLGVLEDANAFVHPGEQAFGFGTVVELSGQTPSGITVFGATGLCLEPAPFRIKKHPLSGYSLNPDCGQRLIQTPNGVVPKPPLFFDFEKLSIQNIPFGGGLSGGVSVACLPHLNLVCEFRGRVEFATPLGVTQGQLVLARGPQGFRFQGGTFVQETGPLRLVGVFTGELEMAWLVQLKAPMEPATAERATWVVAQLEGAPGLGLIDVDGDGLGAYLGLELSRPRFHATVAALLEHRPPGVRLVGLLMRLQARALQRASLDVEALVFNLELDHVRVAMGWQF